jgi:hypothetical protein
MWALLLLLLLLVLLLLLLCVCVCGICTTMYSWRPTDGLRWQQQPWTVLLLLAF